MKVLAIAHFYIEENRAGGEMMLHALLRSLVDDGHDVTCLVTDTIRLNNIVDGVKLIYGATARQLPTYDHDVVVTHFQNAPEALAHCRSTGKPLIYIVHNDMPQTMQLASSIKDGLIVFNSNWIRNKTRHSVNSIVVHPPINKPKAQKSDKDGYITLVNLTLPKGSQIFYQLAKANPNRKFLGVKGGYWKDRQVLESLPNVTIIEMTDDMQHDVYAKSRIILMPSSYETYGMVAAEAMANGIPVIVSKTPGLIENVGDYGIYADYRNMIDWQRAIDQLDDEDEYERYSNLSRERSRFVDTKQEVAKFINEVRKYADI